MFWYVDINALINFNKVLKAGETLSESLEHKFIFQIGSLNPTGINERFSFNLSILVFLVTMFPPTASSIFCIQTYTSQNSSIYFEESLTLETSALKLYAG